MFSGITSILDGLRTDPGGTIITLLYVAVCILFSLIIHECAHGYAALKCGDPTAKWLGRLTLDPRKHLDPLGTICMVFLRIGWAKPVATTGETIFWFHWRELLPICWYAYSA